MNTADVFAESRALEGKVAVITGAAEGARASLGSSFALYLARCGARVVAIDVAEVSSVIERIRTQDGQAFGLRLDISTPENAAKMVQSTLDEFGRLDILVNNAALGSNGAPGPLQEIAAETWDAHMNVNVRGAFLCAQAAARPMAEKGYGKIINIGSPMTQSGAGRRIAYVTSKAATHGLTRALARELGASGIRVNTLTPGYPLTPFTKTEMNAHEGREAAMLAQRSIHAHITPDDIARALAFLASSASDAITGQQITVDNGAVFN